MKKQRIKNYSNVIVTLMNGKEEFGCVMDYCSRGEVYEIIRRDGLRSFEPENRVRLDK